jgi:hypothetical protein
MKKTALMSRRWKTMKVNKQHIVTVFVFLSVLNMYSEADNANLTKFIKGNLADKTAAVKTAAEDESAVLSMKAVDFSIENKAVLGDDRDLSALALTGILSLPQSILSDDKIKPDDLYKKIFTIFNMYSDNTIRIAVIDKIVQFNKIEQSADSVSFIESFLTSSMQAGSPASDVQKTAIDALGDIGSGSSFLIVYNCYTTKIWPQYSNDMEVAIEKLADKSLPEIIKVISSKDITQLNIIFNLFENSSRISDSFKSEIAENILSEALYIAEDSSAVPGELLSLEFNAVRVITKNNWTRASSSVISFFSQAKLNYEKKEISESQFIEAVTAVAALSSETAAKTLSDYLGELNRRAEKNDLPAEQVVLAVIKSLGSLGSKYSFDYLLYVTYLNYPENVIAAARDALTRLKWQN